MKVEGENKWITYFKMHLVIVLEVLSKMRKGDLLDVLY
jgi:hypothetical protein